MLDKKFDAICEMYDGGGHDYVISKNNEKIHLAVCRDDWDLFFMNENGDRTISFYIPKENLPRISKDDEQVALFEKFGFNSNAEKKALVKKADTIILDKLSWFLNKYDSVVLDQWVRERKYIDSLIDELFSKFCLGK